MTTETFFVGARLGVGKPGKRVPYLTPSLAEVMCKFKAGIHPIPPHPPGSCKRSQGLSNPPTHTTLSSLGVARPLFVMSLSFSINRTSCFHPCHVSVSPACSLASLPIQNLIDQVKQKPEGSSGSASRGPSSEDSKTIDRLTVVTVARSGQQWLGCQLWLWAESSRTPAWTWQGQSCCRCLTHVSSQPDLLL